MHFQYLSRQGYSRRIILLLLGWGMDGCCLGPLSRPGYHVAAAWGYGAGDDSQSLRAYCLDYEEVVVVAWSLGVRMASRLLGNGGRLPLTRLIAVNGTPWPQDDDKGIPVRIFQGTLSGLTPLTVRKFRRRMFLSADAFKKFVTPAREFEDLKAELAFLGSLPQEEAPLRWDKALIGEGDAIFPPENQRRAWKQLGVRYQELPGEGHCPDFQRILDREIIDKGLVAERFGAARGGYARRARAQHEVATRLWRAALETGIKPGGKVVEIGVGDGALTHCYSPSLSGDAQLELWDIAPLRLAQIPRGACIRQCDAETEIGTVASGSVDLLLSSSTMQWFNSPLAFLRQVRRVLRPKTGAAAIALYVKGTFEEVEVATGGLALDYLSAEKLISEAKGLFGVVQAATEELSESFDTPLGALRHLKLTGVNALLPPGTNPAATALKLLRHFPLDASGRARLTYRALYLILRP